MSASLSSREFFIVNYPGIVENDERALETLGGLQTITKTFSSITRRLRLSFRPELVYAKPVYGDPKQSTDFIIRARKLRNRRTGEVKVESVIIGIVPRMYTFNSLMDFQYSPFTKVEHPTNNQEKATSSSSPPLFNVFYNDLILKEPLHSLDSHMEKNVELFVPPILFTRLDQPSVYCFSSRFRTNEYVQLDGQIQSRPFHRKERKSYAIFVNYSDPTPVAAHEEAVQTVANLGSHSRKIAHDIGKLFEMRPIWTKAALTYNLKWKHIRETLLKQVLPAYAYYSTHGPWSRVWTRFGYDPRTDSNSRFYQTVDYRVRSPRLQSKLDIRGRRPRLIDKEDVDFSASDMEDILEDDVNLCNENLKNNRAKQKSTKAFLFNKTSWPDARQILYQLTDIDVPEVVEMLAAPVARTVCDPVDGWMPSGHQKHIREILTKYLDIWVFENE